MKIRMKCAVKTSDVMYVGGREYEVTPEEAKEMSEFCEIIEDEKPVTAAEPESEPEEDKDTLNMFEAVAVEENKLAPKKPATKRTTAKKPARKGTKKTTKK